MPDSPRLSLTQIFKGYNKMGRKGEVAIPNKSENTKSTRKSAAVVPGKNNKTNDKYTRQDYRDLDLDTSESESESEEEEEEEEEEDVNNLDGDRKNTLDETKEDDVGNDDVDDDESEEEDDDDENKNLSAVIMNHDASKQSRIVKVIPKNCDEQFYFEKHSNNREVIYLPQSFSLSDNSVNAAIRSAEWKNSSVIMPLDFIFLKQKSMTENLIVKNGDINSYLTSRTGKGYVNLLGMKNPSGSLEPFEHFQTATSANIEDLYISVSIILRKTSLYLI